MLSTRNKIILVDDNKDHLNSLSDAFFNQKISCLPIVYDVMHDDPMSGIRIAFFDINLLNSSNESIILATILGTLPKYISEDNGPFALIFWTDKKDLIPKIKEHIKERGGEKFPKPFIVDCIDKDEFYGEGNEENLILKLNEVFKEPTLNIMVDYENVVGKAVNKTVNQFFEIIPSNDDWGENVNYKENFEKIFSSIASSTLGFNHAKENPDKAIYSALTENVKHHVEHSKNKGYWKDALTSLANVPEAKKIEFVEGFNYSILNNLLHIEINNGLFCNSDRGVLIKLKKVFLRKHKTNFTAFYSSMLKFSSVKANKQSEYDKELKKSISQSRLICIEISAGCDHSQKINRINTYLVGFIAPKLAKVLKPSNPLPAKTFRSISFMEDKKEMQLWLNLNYSIELDKKDKNIEKIEFKLKSEIVNQIGNRYANHLSRIGITSF